LCQFMGRGYRKRRRPPGCPWRRYCRLFIEGSHRTLLIPTSVLCGSELSLAGESEFPRIALHPPQRSFRKSRGLHEREREREREREKERGEHRGYSRAFGVYKTQPLLSSVRREGDDGDVTLSERKYHIARASHPFLRRNPKSLFTERASSGSGRAFRGIPTCAARLDRHIIDGRNASASCEPRPGLAGRFEPQSPKTGPAAPPAVA